MATRPKRKCKLCNRVHNKRCWKRQHLKKILAGGEVPTPFFAKKVLPKVAAHVARKRTA